MSQKTKGILQKTEIYRMNPLGEIAKVKRGNYENQDRNKLFGTRADKTDIHRLRCRE